MSNQSTSTAAALLGSLRSSKKAMSSAANGKLGGRPSKFSVTGYPGDESYEVTTERNPTDNSRIVVRVDVDASPDKQTSKMYAEIMEWTDHLDMTEEAIRIAAKRAVLRELNGN